MNKASLICAVFALIALNVSALDIKTADGTVYKDVDVTNVMPDAIGIAYVKKDGTYVLRDIKLSELTPELQKKYNYSPKKAEEFHKKVVEYQTEREALQKKHQEEDLALLHKQQKRSKELDHIKAALYAHRIACWIHIIRAVGTEDCIGKVSYPESTTKYGNLGSMYIRNLTGSQNARIAAVIYPTNQSKSFEDGMFPVYDADLNKYALEILQEQEEGKDIQSELDAAPKTMQFPGNPSQSNQNQDENQKKNHKKPESTINVM
jgi:Rps23 Pro-64 3,4-dihydroxylase Tpa1-like proline 4-hydroxylase